MHTFDAVIFMHILDAVMFMYIFDAVVFMQILDVVIFMYVLNVFDIYQILYANLIDRFSLVYIYQEHGGPESSCPGGGIF